MKTEKSRKIKISSLKLEKFPAFSLFLAFFSPIRIFIQSQSKNSQRKNMKKLKTISIDLEASPLHQSLKKERSEI